MNVSETSTSGVKFPPPFIYVAFFLLGLLIQWFFWWPIPVPRTAALALAGVLLACGLTLVGWSIALFLRAKTSPLPYVPTTALVTRGPYQYTRNPMYVGLFLIYLGVALWFSLLWPLVVSPLIIPAVNIGVIRREEKYLDARFGEAYRTYRSEIPRWF